MQQEKILRRQEKKKLSGIKVKVCLVYLRKKKKIRQAVCLTWNRQRASGSEAGVMGAEHT